MQKKLIDLSEGVVRDLGALAKAKDMRLKPYMELVLTAHSELAQEDTYLSLLSNDPMSNIPVSLKQEQNIYNIISASC